MALTTDLAANSGSSGRESRLVNERGGWARCGGCFFDAGKQGVSQR